MFDEDVYERDLKMLEACMQDEGAGGPVLNYVLGMYGHYPYYRNRRKRPDIVSVAHPNPHLTNIANQFHYRTKSLGKFLDRLVERDPHGLIVVVSDHLPSILDGDTKCREERHHNIALFIENGTPLDISGKRYYQLPWMIWDKLQNKTERVGRDCSDEKLEQLYLQVLAESRGLFNKTSGG